MQALISIKNSAFFSFKNSAQQHQLFYLQKKNNQIIQSLIILLTNLWYITTLQIFLTQHIVSHQNLKNIKNSFAFIKQTTVKTTNNIVKYLQKQQKYTKLQKNIQKPMRYVLNSITTDSAKLFQLLSQDQKMYIFNLNQSNIYDMLLKQIYLFTLINIIQDQYQKTKSISKLWINTTNSIILFQQHRIFTNVLQMRLDETCTHCFVCPSRGLLIQRHNAIKNFIFKKCTSAGFSLSRKSQIYYLFHPAGRLIFGFHIGTWIDRGLLILQSTLFFTNLISLIQHKIILPLVKKANRILYYFFLTL
eukprot:TRINITY_DN3220_c0_g2_i4.p1 TRINITY_DN3220_c0_g2~~TRINITY_DN3220_c0_g2_i4.p1  ORF type:complete len:336 (+),score=-27.47 TRINITY_DN3220_c0_g2_i4:98-1009(+)